MGVDHLSAPIIGVSTSEVRFLGKEMQIAQGEPAQRELKLGLEYVESVERAGGLPIVLPPTGLASIEPLLAILDGVCVPGGPDLDPAVYGHAPGPDLGPTEPELDRFEIRLVRRAEALGIPVLGICRGMQLMNVTRDGTLHQHIPNAITGDIAHRQGERGNFTTHSVTVDAGSAVAAAIGAGLIDVNSFHHQAIDRVGRGLRVVAHSADGVIEAIEDTDHRFFLGVQWHAESLSNRRPHSGLFEALVEAARRRRRERSGGGAGRRLRTARENRAA